MRHGKTVAILAVALLMQLFGAPAQVSAKISDSYFEAGLGSGSGAGEEFKGTEEETINQLPEITEETPPEITEELPPEITEELSPEITEELSPEIIEELPPEIIEETLFEFTEELPLEILEELPPVNNTVTTLDELMEWLNQNSPQGGCVYLGANINIDNQQAKLTPQSPVLINTGCFGFIVNNASFTVNHNITITGEGVENPVILSNSGNLMFSNGTKIISTGRNGQGGVTVCSEDNAYIALPQLTEQPCLIRAEGNGAFAIRAAGDIIIEYLSIEAAGANSVAVYSETSINAFMSRVTAHGKGATPVISPESILDTCIVAPEAENATVFNRYIAGAKGYSKLRYYLAVGEDLVLDSSPLLALAADGYEETSSYIDIDWEDTPIDTSEPVIIRIPGKILPPFDAFNLDKGLGLETVIEVLDPTLPHFTYIYTSFSLFFRATCLDVQLLRAITNIEDAALLYSEDNGQTWLPFPQDKYYFDGRFLSIPLTELTSPMLMQLQVAGMGATDIYQLYWDGTPLSGIGGDRVGDRIMNKWEPPKEVPYTPPNKPTDKHTDGVSSDNDSYIVEDTEPVIIEDEIIPLHIQPENTAAIANTNGALDNQNLPLPLTPDGQKPRSNTLIQKVEDSLTSGFAHTIANAATPVADDTETQPPPTAAEPPFAVPQIRPVQVPEQNQAVDMERHTNYFFIICCALLTAAIAMPALIGESKRRKKNS